MSSILMTKEQALTQNFVNLLIQTRAALATTGDPAVSDFKENTDLMKYLRAKYQKVNVASLVQELESRGLLLDSAPEQQTPQQPAQHQPAAGAEQPKTQAQQPVREQAEQPQQPAQQAPAQQPQQPAPGVNTQSEGLPSPEGRERVARSLEALRQRGPVGVDSKGWIRTSDRKYVCPLCVESGEGPLGIFCADTPRGIGPHTRSHASKVRVNVDLAIADLPLFDDRIPLGPTAPAQETGMPDTGHRVATPAEVRGSPDTEAPDTSSEEPPAWSDLVSKKGLEPQAPERAVPHPEFMTALDARFARLEATVANILVVVLSMPDSRRQALYDEFAKGNVARIVDILSREV